MAVVTKHVQIVSGGENDVIDLTQEVQRCVSETKLTKGVVILFVSGSTGAVTTMEYEPGLVKDFPAMLERAAPKSHAYEHQKTWHDNNGHSHVKASLVGPSLAVPFVDGKLTLGTWQQVVFVELDVRPRTRKIVLQIVGE
ncbi:MAG: secondary thiamine-phosphate synthase enzyme YjbQ [Nitrososphaerales archaeon]